VNLDDIALAKRAGDDLHGYGSSSAGWPGLRPLRRPHHTDPARIRQRFSPCSDPLAMTSPSPWWDRDVHADRRPLLAARGRIRQALRQFFEKEDFTEVEAAILQVSPGNEA